MVRKVFLFLALVTAGTATEATAQRALQYRPEGREVVCLNGQNRYTRALYGTHSAWRLETSDRPVFATYGIKRKENSQRHTLTLVRESGKWKENSGKNFRFLLTKGGRTWALDKTDWCEARYIGGRRSYVVKDGAWGRGTLYITAMASFFQEGAIWQVRAAHFQEAPVLTVRMCDVAKPDMKRNGDLGVEPRSSFEAAPDERGLVTLTTPLNEEVYIVFEEGEGMRLLDTQTGRQQYAREEAARQQLTTQVEVTTPDAYINTLGANLMAAADGCWEGSWLHGCIGWRTPLAGWRAGYLGDVLGWNGRAVEHFNAYAKSMVTDVAPTIAHSTQDAAKNLARAEKRWGTQLYSNGYICRQPYRTDQMSHYDMNLCYVDELLWHFQYDADTTLMRQLWPYLKLHLAWEKRNFDADGDGLYDAYCCIWASDALYYNSGGVTHATAYNYRGNLLAARIAERLGEDATPYRQEAEKILRAMNRELWLEQEGHWAEFKDFMGLKRLHKSAALWSIYTPISCGACTPRQAWRATQYVDQCIPHIPLDIQGEPSLDGLYTLSTSNWTPYEWSINNVAHAEVMNTALAYFEAGRGDEGYRLLKADVLDEMFLGASPANFGQVSYYDKARSETYRDFSDNIGITAVALIRGLFGIVPQALEGRCILRPALPEEWQTASIRTPYLSYDYHREAGNDVYVVRQHFKEPLQVVLRVPTGDGEWQEVQGTRDSVQTLVTVHRRVEKHLPTVALASSRKGFDNPDYLRRMGLDEPTQGARQRQVAMDEYFNSNVDDIFRNEYLSPRSPYTTLELPKQGLGDWCSTDRTATIEDDGLRQVAKNDIFDTGIGIRFCTPRQGRNIVYTSLWDNYPDSVVIPLKGRAQAAWLMLAGSTNPMQSRIDNGVVTVTYDDGTTDVMPLENPTNWCPIEQDYYFDGQAFWMAAKRPYRFHLATGKVSRQLGDVLGIRREEVSPRSIPCGAGVLLKMPLNAKKRLRSLTLRTLSNDVVIGLMAVTLEIEN